MSAPIESVIPRRLDAPNPDGWFMVGERGYFRTGDQYPVVRVSYEILSLHRTSAEAAQVCASVGECESCHQLAPLACAVYDDTTFKVCAGCAPDPAQGALL